MHAPSAASAQKTPYMNGRDVPRFAEVNVYVRNMDIALDDYRKLGFRVPSKADIYPLPSGLVVTEILFQDGPVLEFRAVHKRKNAVGQRPRAVEFLKRHEGVLHLVLNVPSASVKAVSLRRHGYRVSDPRPSPFLLQGSVPFWYLVFDGFFDLADRARRGEEGSPTRAVAFSEVSPIMKKRSRQKRSSRQFRQWFKHDNTAKAIRSVWIAVRDLESATRAYVSIGLLRGRRRKVRRLGAICMEVNGRAGCILLLQPSDAHGVVASFMKGRGEGVMGLSIEVRNLLAARRVIEGTGQRIVPYAGAHGRSLLVPADLAHGVWIEMFQGR
ncbi:MAG TPA: VOC family protein [Thermoplasmata archaeon]